MKIIIQKFGGTLIADLEKRQAIVKCVQDAVREGYCPVVVVSAMGRAGDPYATDTLKSQALDIYENISLRELDLIMSCGEVISAVVTAATLNEKGIKARVFTGAQAGLITDGTYAHAEVIDCQPTKIRQSLEMGEVAIITGFQGQSRDGELNTLGRGGSDTTAVILGAALGADKVEIYSDVLGIMTADPRVCKDARTINRLTYSEVCQMAYEGAKVIHPSAVEVAMQHNVNLIIKNPLNPEQGTVITSDSNMCKGGSYKAGWRRIVTGIAHTTDLSQISVEFGKPDPAMELLIFQKLSDAGISIDLINIFPTLKVFTIKEDVLLATEHVLKELGVKFRIERACAKVSVVGVGMRNIPGVMARVVKAMDEKEIEILQTGDSNITISLLIHQEDLIEAVKALHDYFELNNVSMLV